MLPSIGHYVTMMLKLLLLPHGSHISLLCFPNNFYIKAMIVCGGKDADLPYTEFIACDDLMGVTLPFLGTGLLYPVQTQSSFTAQIMSFFNIPFNRDVRVL